jgi:hypothetical protein
MDLAKGRSLENGAFSKIRFDRSSLFVRLI